MNLMFPTQENVDLNYINHALHVRWKPVSILQISSRIAARLRHSGDQHFDSFNRCAYLRLGRHYYRIYLNEQR